MKYIESDIEDRDKIKKIAYEIEPEIWISYSGKSKEFKQDIDEQRRVTLDYATHLFYNNL